MNRKATTLDILGTSNSSGKLLSLKGYSVVLYHTVDEISKANWAKATSPDNLFLQLDYLSVVEKHPPKGMKFCYLLFYKENVPVGVSLFQLQYFKADQNINNKDNEKRPCFFTVLTRFIKGVVANKAEFNVLINGNLLLTGEHGNYFNKELVSNKDFQQILDEALDYTHAELDKNGNKLSGTLLKEYYECNKEFSTQFAENHSFFEFTVQPNMVMKLREEWCTFDDYMEAMLSKYRVRTKRALKKGSDFEKVDFDAEMIESNLDRLYELYEGIAENSGFNMVNLNKNYLLALKKQFPDRFKLTGYYLEGKLVGYYTTILNDVELEAHFLGFEQSLNRDHQIYLNILYDIVNEGILRRAKKIIFARTAMEIKSSVGAVAEEMFCYLRARSSLTNKLFLKPVLEYLRPDHDWEPRHPFKTDS
jgi:hypothetical protein